jgi:hypothetical protein
MAQVARQKWAKPGAAASGATKDSAACAAAELQKMM